MNSANAQIRVGTNGSGRLSDRYTKALASTIRLSVVMPVYNERFLIEAAVQRVLSFKHPKVSDVELIIVDDGSKDGTREILRRICKNCPNIIYIEQPNNQGKGAAIRRGIHLATGEISVIQDADLEYYPDDWAALLPPFFEADADAVYGSRFMAGNYRRIQAFWHTLGNQVLTLFSNLMTGLNLTDMETCYKMVRTELLKSIPIRSDDFSIEPELTAKLAKRGAVIFEVPIRYAGRTYQEGKKISAKHGVRAFTSMVKWKFIDDLYQDDVYGAEMLTSLTHVHQFNKWMADLIAPMVGMRVLEIGAGIGMVTIRLLPREEYWATDINPHYLAYLHNLSVGKPYFHVSKLDITDTAAFVALREHFDTVVCLNVIEHVDDPVAALKNIYSALEVGGKAIVMVAQGQWLTSSLDTALHHQRRYSHDEVVEFMQQAGFVVQSAQDYNKVGSVGWALNGKLLRRQHFPRVQLKVLNMLTPVIKRVDPYLPWPGLSVAAVGIKK